MFTKEAQDIIKQYLCFILKENDDDESGYVNADDINDDQMLIAALMVMLKIVMKRIVQNSKQ